MTRNQLPEGVGKKIVEALKRQAEADITPVVTEDDSISKNISFNDVQEEISNFEALKEKTDNQETTENFIVEEVQNNTTEDTETLQNTETVQDINTNMSVNTNTIQNFNTMQGFNTVQNINTQEEIFAQPQSETMPEPQIFNAAANIETPTSTPATFKVQEEVSNLASSFNTNIPLSDEPKQPVPTVTITLPTNVAVLRNLIASLPVGVTKQTGAQIIRQTLEAMGLPMSNVLKEAQVLQEELTTNTRECMLRIQEFKTNILQLEQSVQEYQKYITQINDLVSLFLLTDRK